MFWIAIEDTDTHEASSFEKVTEKKLLYILDGYRVDKHDSTRFRLQDEEEGRHVIYKGIKYKGGFGYNIWVARKYREV